MAMAWSFFETDDLPARAYCRFALPTPSGGAQSVQWKAIACTAENPEVVRGNAVTVYFTESRQVHFEGTQYPATVTRAEISFCFRNANSRLGCYMISRISGRFTITMTGSGKINSSCTPEGQKPKF